MASRLNLRRHLGDATRALGDDDEVHDHQNGEDNHADDEVAAHDEVAEGLDDLAGGVGSFVTVGQDQTRRCKVRASRKIVAISRTVGKDEKSSGRDMNSATIMISTEKVIEMAREPVEQPTGHRHDEDDQDADDTHRERDVAPPQGVQHTVERPGPPAAPGAPPAGGSAVWFSAASAIQAALPGGSGQAVVRSESPGAGTGIP